MRINWKDIYKDRDIFSKQDVIFEVDYLIKTLKSIKNAIKDNDLEQVYRIWEYDYNDFIVIDLINYIENRE